MSFPAHPGSPERVFPKGTFKTIQSFSFIVEMGNFARLQRLRRETDVTLVKQTLKKEFTE